MENNLPKEFNWEMVQTYAEISDFYCALSNLQMVNECKDRNIKFYYKYTVTSTFELNTLKDLGVAYALVGVPLIFDLKNIAAFGVPLRVIANLAYEPYLIRQNGIVGGWIRPEDVSKYGEYITALEFYAPDNLDKEKALFHTYAEKGQWPGNLNLLIDNLGINVDNRLIYDSEGFAERRMSCRQKCQNAVSTCHYCEDQLNFAKDVLPLYKEYKN